MSCLYSSRNPPTSTFFFFFKQTTKANNNFSINSLIGRWGKIILRLYYPNDIRVFVTFRLTPIIYFIDISETMCIHSAQYFFCSWKVNSSNKTNKTF